MAALTPEERKEIADIMSQSKPSRALTDYEQAYGLNFGKSEYDTKIQVPGSIWSMISPAMLARRVFNKVRSQLTRSNSRQSFVYTDEDMSYPRGNIVLAEMDRQNDKWEKLSDPIYHDPPQGRQSDKDLFERTLYDEMKAIKGRQMGRELTGVKEVGLAKNLPNELEALTGQFLSGKKGTVDGQMDQLRQDTGEAMAPRPSGRPEKPMGGRRKTKKSKRRSRKTRRRHR
jgi:hypothetical protein